MNEKPTLNIVLVEPRIPQNTGNVARTCACTACRLHLVGPMGFAIDDKKLKHAGAGLLALPRHQLLRRSGRVLCQKQRPLLLFFTTKAPQRYTDVSYPDGAYLVFGREDAGLPEACLPKIRALHPDAHAGHLPQPEPSNSVAVGVYEVLRQWDFPELLDHGHLRDYEWK